MTLWLLFTVEKSYKVLVFLLEMVESDINPYLRHRVLQMIADNPPFNKKEDNLNLNSDELVERLWKLMK